MDLGPLAMKRCSAFPKDPGSPSDRLVSYPGLSLGCLTPLQRGSRYIQQPQPTGQAVNKAECILCFLQGNQSRCKGTLKSNYQIWNLTMCHMQQVLYCRDQLYIYTCWNIFNTIITSGHSSLEKYTSHFIERVVCERELETELQHIDPHFPGYYSISFPFSWADQPGAWGPPSAGTWFSFQHLLSNSCEHPVTGVI